MVHTASPGPFHPHHCRHFLFVHTALFTFTRKPLGNSHRKLPVLTLPLHLLQEASGILNMPHKHAQITSPQNTHQSSEWPLLAFSRNLNSFSPSGYWCTLLNGKILLMSTFYVLKVYTWHDVAIDVKRLDELLVPEGEEMVAGAVGVI